MIHEGGSTLMCVDLQLCELHAADADSGELSGDLDLDSGLF